MATEGHSDAYRPVVAITMGDPAGVGPEVTVGALAAEEVHRACQPVVIGDATVLRYADELLGTGLPVQRITKVSEATAPPRTLNVLDLANVNWQRLERRQVSALAGRAAVEYVETAIHLAQSGQVDAIVTAPINKQAINLAGYHYMGHTEILADLTNSPGCTTMLATGELRVTHVTRHVPLRQVADHITRERVLQTIITTSEGLQRLGIERPRVGVAALNPHSGDGGLLGREELEQIGPAVQEARALGIDAQGPHPADTIFVRAARGEFDVVVAMYHDQGHIPIKVSDFERSYTVTLGLPIVRTSVDHGTAFDIAWQGVASPQSMIAAILAAARLAGALRD
jgi:4-hydroxythreonine-4-phosphate dehydrogenase